MCERMPGVGASDCERLRAGPVAQPVNTLTSLAYVAAGLWIGRRRGSGAGSGLPQRIFGATVVGVGLGSVAFHGAATAWGKWLHDKAILAVVLFVLAWNGQRIIAARRRGRSLREIGRDLASTHAGLAVLLGVGGAIALASRTGAPLCRPGSRLQGHGVWHVLTAIALVVWAEARLGSDEAISPGGRCGGSRAPAPTR
ncbi:MAG: hypothetical protein IT198_15735 [Acidimicrobiia bacterium]|nr:hypothetical protein [Acidimicrobiia bacterium]